MAYKKFLSDYKEVNISDKDKKGKTKKCFIYIGKYYSISFEHGKYTRYKIVSAVIIFMIFGLFFTGATLNNESSRIFYIAIPYISIFLPASLLAGGLFNLCISPEKMTEKQYAKSIVRMKNSTLAIMILSISSTVGDLIFSIISRNLSETYFIFICTLIFTISYIFFKLQKNFINSII